MTIVLDTNVLVSGLLNPQGTPAEIVNLLLNHRIEFLIENRILLEHETVLRRKKFNFPVEAVSALMDFLKHEGKFIIPEPSNAAFQDEDDKKFYEAALSGNAHYLVTGNQIHFPKDDMIISPAEFLEKYRKQDLSEYRV